MPFFERMRKMAVKTTDYLSKINDLLAMRWPDNRTVNIVCHGHSVPSGYRCTPYVDPFHSYPHLLHRLIKERFPYAVVNVIVTAIGGENSMQGAARFREEVLCHRPDVLTIDYGLNDRQISLEQAKTSWKQMIEEALAKDIKVILLTPTWEQSCFEENESWQLLLRHADQIRSLAEEYEVGLSDTFEMFDRYVRDGGAPQDLFSHVNHPSDLGHEMVARNLSRWFIAH